ncbi:hypothetical protein [Lysinibacillus fusiformis]|uniref:hypothetical protein n=1 Tax=Lysinibacillus fusiformis TaxID=28031 RepID=UPI003AADCE78
MFQVFFHFLKNKDLIKLRSKEIKKLYILNLKKWNNGTNLIEGCVDFMEVKESSFDKFTEEKILPLLKDTLPEEVQIIVAKLYKLKKNKYKDLKQIEKDKILEDFMGGKNNEGKNEDIGEEIEELKKKRDEVLRKRISLIVLKSTILKLMIEAFNKEKLDSNQYYQDNEMLYKDIKKIFKKENNKNNKVTYDLDKKKRISFFLSDLSYSNWFDLFKTIEKETMNFKPSVSKSLLPYYLYSIYQSSKEDTLNLKIKTLYKQPINYNGRNNKIYSMKKYQNFIDKFKNEKLDFVDLETIMAKNELKKNLQIKDLDIPKNKKDKGKMIKEFRKLVNFDRRFYYFALKFYDLKTYSEITNESRKKLKINSSINLLILNKFDRLYDAMYLVPILKNYKPELLKDKTSLAAIMNIDDFNLKSELIKNYDKESSFDYVNFTKILDEIIERTKKIILSSFRDFFKTKEVYQIAVEYFEFLDVEDTQIIKNLRREIKKWNRLGNLDKLNFIEEFGNNLILLDELDKIEGK